jgi:predicted transcriptional regulator
MDKILSARVDESVLSCLGNLAVQLHKSKKSIIENAILRYAAQVEEAEIRDVFDCAFGAWKRKEEPAETVNRSRSAFNKSMTRHHQ